MERGDSPNIFLAGLVCVLLLIALFTNLGISPLRLEEPRRALVALEMLFNNNLLVPTVKGELYYNKPPLFNWAIIAGYTLFGNYSEFAVRFPSVCSFLLIGALVFFMGKKYVGLSFGIYSSLLFLTSADILFNFSLLGEIDLFYALITFGSFITLYSFYQSQQYYLLFLSTYFLGALGTLTKGFPSLVFLGISLLVFFLYNKDVNTLLSVPHFLGITLYISLIAGYFWLYSSYESPGNFIQTLWWESMKRTVVAEKHRVSLMQHIAVFPLRMVESTFPASLLLMFAVKKNFLQKIRQNPLIEFSGVMLISNILVYWISPGTRTRYVYMLFPFMIMILTYFYLHDASTDRNRLRIFHGVAGILIALSVITCFSLPVIPDLDIVQHVSLLSIISGVAGVLVLIFFTIMKQHRLLFFLLAIILVRIVFNFTILPARATHGKNQMKKHVAYKIVDICQDEPLYILNETRFSNTVAFYIERERGKVLTKKKTMTSNDFFLVDQRVLKNERYTVLYRFQIQNTEFLLIKSADTKTAADRVKGV